MGRIWAVARLTLSEAIRRKVAIVFVAMMAVTLAGLPLVMKGDGTLAGQVSAYLAYSLSTLGFLLGMLTVFLACGAIALEISNRHIFMTGTKPLPRWQLLAGKFLGIALLDAVLLGGGAGIVYGVARYMGTLPGRTEQDRLVLQNEVLAARGGIPSSGQDFSAEVEERFERMRELGQLVEPDAVTTRRVKDEIKLRLLADSHRVHFGQSKVHVFENVLVDRKRGDFLHLRYKFMVVPEPPREMWSYFWVIGDAEKGTRQLPFARTDRMNIAVEMPIPVEFVAPDGTLRVELVNLPLLDEDGVKPARMQFEEQDLPELLFHLGTFGGNILRATIIIYCRLLFLLAAGLCASTVLGFPVACLVCLTLFLAATMSGYIATSLEELGEPDEFATVLDYFMWLIKPVAEGVLWLVPKFSMFNPVPTLVSGRAVTLLWVLDAAARLVVIRATIFALLALVLLQRRELADTSTS